jgi:hypothetical protein
VLLRCDASSVVDAFWVARQYVGAICVAVDAARAAGRVTDALLSQFRADRRTGEGASGAKGLRFGRKLKDDPPEYGYTKTIITVRLCRDGTLAEKGNNCQLVHLVHHVPSCTLLTDQPALIEQFRGSKDTRVSLFLDVHLLDRVLLPLGFTAGGVARYNLVPANHIDGWLWKLTCEMEGVSKTRVVDAPMERAGVAAVYLRQLDNVLPTKPNESVDFSFSCDGSTPIVKHLYFREKAPGGTALVHSDKKRRAFLVRVRRVLLAKSRTSKKLEVSVLPSAPKKRARALAPAQTRKSC